MRFVAALLFLCTASLATNASALSVCPTSEYTIAFESDEFELDEGDLELIEASVNRARQCDINRFELIVFGDFATAETLANRRADAVRDALVSRGLDAQLIQTLNESSGRHGIRIQPAPSAVKVIVFFD